MELLSDIHLSELISTLVYCGVGLIFFIVAYFVMEMILPFPVRKEIEEDQNVSLGVILGAMIIGLAIIIASAIASPSSPDKVEKIKVEQTQPQKSQE